MNVNYRWFKKYRENIENNKSSANSSKNEAKPSRIGGVIKNFFGGGGGGGDGDKNGKDSGPFSHPIDPNITLASVGGLTQHVNFLKMGILYPIKHAGSLQEWGIEPPKAIMFHG